MAEKRKRGQNFTVDEKEKLVKLLVAHKETILNKKTDGSTNEAKQKAWVNVTNSFNSSGTIYRTKDSLMKIWEKLKTESKIYYQSKQRSTTGTGGGPADLKVDPILEQVCAILGRACTGILGVQDCDSELETAPPPPKKILFSELDNILQLEYIEDDIVHDTEIDQQSASKEEISDVSLKENVPTEKYNTPKMPIWSRRRPQLSQTNERSEAVSSICSSFTNVNKKKEDIEDLKKILLQDEIEFKRKLYSLQLEAATKEVEIKTEILNQVKSGGLNLQHLFGGTEKK